MQQQESTWKEKCLKRLTLQKRKRQASKDRGGYREVDSPAKVFVERSQDAQPGMFAFVRERVQSNLPSTRVLEW